MRYVGLALCVSAASIVFACGGSDSNGGNTPGAIGGAAGETPVDNPPPGGAPPSEGGTGNSTAGNPTAGKASTPAGGEGGATEPGVVSNGTPRPGNGNVVDGIVAHSSNFTMVLSVGEEPGGNLSMSSSMYRVNLGVVGSTQK
jgi:hypothetical protein